MTDDIRLSPNVEIPLLNARLSLENLEEQDTNLIADSDNALRIRFRHDSLFSFSAIDFVEIPAQQEVTVPISKSAPMLNSDLALGTLGGVELQNATFEKGFYTISLETSTTFSTNVDIKVTLKHTSNAGQLSEKTLTLTAGNLSVIDSIDLSNVTFDFTAGQQKINYIGLSIEMLNPGGVTETHPVDVKTQFKNLQLENAEGFFGQREINIPSGDFDFDLEGISEFVDGLYLTDPLVRIITTTTLGASLGLQLDLDGVNSDGNVVALDADTEILKGAVSPIIPVQNVIEFSPLNSKVADFLANLPSTILFSGKAEINPPGESKSNFINKNSGVTADLEVDVPLKFTANNVKLDQTLEIDDLQDMSEDLEKFDMLFYVDNGLPFNVDVDVSFLESETGDSLQGFKLASLFTAAPVDGDGRVTNNAPMQKVEQSFTEQMILDLNKCDKIRFVARLSTANNGSKVAALYSDYELSIKVATRAKLKLN